MSTVALWLGHESEEPTQIYLEATLAMKEQVLAKVTRPYASDRQTLTRAWERANRTCVIRNGARESDRRGWRDAQVLVRPALK
jgi:hypothetical protein